LRKRSGSKKDCGFVKAEDSEPEMGGIEVTRIGTDEKLKVNLDELAEVITARVDEILQAIKLELIKSGYWGSLHSGVVITGGSAGLKNIAKRANEIL